MKSHIMTTEEQEREELICFIPEKDNLYPLFIGWEQECKGLSGRDFTYVQQYRKKTKTILGR